MLGLVFKMSGVGYVILNALRVLNIISLLGVIAASVVMLIKTFIVTGYFFFDSLSHVILMLMAIFLIISEVPLVDRVRNFYSRNMPLLSYQSGVGPLGFFLIILACFVLSNLNNNQATSDDFGHSFFSTIIAGGLLPFIAGILNIAASFIWQDRKLGITSRMIRHFGSAKAKNIARDVNANSDFYARNADIESRPESRMTERTEAPLFQKSYAPSSHYSINTEGMPQRPNPAYSAGR